MSKVTEIYFPHAPNQFYADITITVNAQGVTDVKGSDGNESLDQQISAGVMTLQVKDHQGTEVYQTIKIDVSNLIG